MDIPLAYILIIFLYIFFGFFTLLFMPRDSSLLEKIGAFILWPILALVVFMQLILAFIGFIIALYYSLFNH